MVIRQGIHCRLYFIHPLHDKSAVDTEIGRKADQPPGVFNEFRLLFTFLDATQYYIAAGMADAGDRTQHEHLAELLRKTKGVHHHILGFLGGTRLQYRYVSLPGYIAVILLVLGAPLA